MQHTSLSRKKLAVIQKLQLHWPNIQVLMVILLFHYLVAYPKNAGIWHIALKKTLPAFSLSFLCCVEKLWLLFWLVFRLISFSKRELSFLYEGQCSLLSQVWAILLGTICIITLKLSSRIKMCFFFSIKMATMLFLVSNRQYPGYYLFHSNSKFL